MMIERIKILTREGTMEDRETCSEVTTPAGMEVRGPFSQHRQELRTVLVSQ
jgi:hypothetical protein